MVYAKPPFGGPETVLKYLSRYTHRVAISNRRILFVGQGVVRFRYRDYADRRRTKHMTLAATEFLRRFLLHVVPRHFMRIRHYGITANRHRQTKLARCRELLGASAPIAPAASTDFTADTSNNPHDSERRTDACPVCGGALRIIELLAPRPDDSS